MAIVFPNGLSGWLDYDRDHLPSLDEQERIDYFEARVQRVFLGPLKELWQKTATEKDTSSLLIVGMTACCGIEALGRFAGGSALGNGDRFRHFATKFMSPELQVSFGTTTRLEALWFHFRHGLAHGFAVCHGGFEENAGSYFAVKNHSGYDVLEVSPTRLLADLENGFTTYIKQLRADCPTGSFLAFDVEFTSVFIDGN